MLRFLILIVFLATIASSHSSQWVDPHSMKMDEKAKYNMKPPLKKTIIRPEGSLSESDVPVDVPFNLSNAVLKRMLIILMKSAHLDKNDPENYTGAIHFNINPKDYDFLNSLGEENLLQPDQLQRIDTIFSEGFRKSHFDIYMEEITASQTKLYHLLNMQNMWILAAICLMYYMYNIIKNDFSLAKIVKYLFFLLFIVDSGYRYNHLLNEAEEYNFGVVYSSKCDTSKKNWSQWIKHIFSSEDCHKKTVTPLDVFLYQVKNLIIVPTEALGTGLGAFGNKMFTELPWGLSLVMWPIMLIFVILSIFTICMICTKKSFEFSLIPLRITFGENAPTRSNLTSESAHRPQYVQNIHLSIPSGVNQPVESSNNNSTQSGDHIPQAVQLNRLSLKQNVVEDDSKSSGTKERETREMGTNTKYIKQSEVNEGGDSFENANRFIEEVVMDNTLDKPDGTLRQRVVADKFNVSSQ